MQTTSVDGVPYTGVVAIPLTDVHHTLGRLLLVEVLVSGVVLVGLGVLASWIVRRNLRPLDQMAATAGAIAGGDLSQRVATTDEYTEVGQLGNALNVMLAGIEGAFAARAASEERLRRFLADASHELRTPLTSIRGYSELFDRARDRPEDLATSMRHIREEANRMSVLVDDLLLLARLDHQRPIALEPVDLTGIVAAAVDAARLRAPDRVVGLRAPGPVDVVGDADRLRQVVDNLLTNAELHTPDGTPIEVEVRTEAAFASVAVSDHGPGIAPDEQAHIFEPFHRADPTRARATGGVGLGLSIVSAIAHAHGGTVGVMSDPASTNGHGGATFWVRIPVATAAGAPAAPVDAPPVHSDEPQPSWGSDPGHTGEAREAVHEGEGDHAGGPVAVLGDDDLGRAPLGRFGVVDLVAVDEQHDIGVLLDRARLPQVGEHGPLVLAHLEVPGQLRQGHHGDVELTGEDLQPPADLRHLDLAVLGPALGVPAHELEVVDDDEAEALARP